MGRRTARRLVQTNRQIAARVDDGCAVQIDAAYFRDEQRVQLSDGEIHGVPIHYRWKISSYTNQSWKIDSGLPIDVRKCRRYASTIRCAP